MTAFRATVAEVSSCDTAQETATTGVWACCLHKGLVGVGEVESGVDSFLASGFRILLKLIRAFCLPGGT